MSSSISALRDACTFQELNDVLHQQFFPSAKNDEEYNDNPDLKTSETLAVFLDKKNLLLGNNSMSEKENGKNDDDGDKNSVASDGPENDSADLFAIFFAWFAFENPNLKEQLIDDSSLAEGVRDAFVEMIPRVGSALTANRFIDCFDHFLWEKINETSSDAFLELFGTKEVAEAINETTKQTSYRCVSNEVAKMMTEQTGIEMEDN